MPLKLRKFQALGVKFALNRPASINGDEMGLGKTIQLIHVWKIMSRRAGRPVFGLVVCPAFLAPNWQIELSRWAPEAQVQWLETRKDRIKPQANILIIAYSVLGSYRQALDQLRLDLLLVDEAHYLQNPAAQRTKFVLGGVVKKRRWSKIKATRRVFATGTPMAIRPINLWPLARSIDPKDLGRSFAEYTLRYCGPKPGWGGAIDYRGASNLDEFNFKLRKFMIRRLKSEVQTEIPPKTRQTIFITAKAKKARALISREYDAYRMARNSDVMSRHQLWGELSKIRKEIALYKLPFMFEFIEDLILSGPLVVFAWHREVLDRMQAQFGKRCTLVYGGISNKERQRRVQAFQAGEFSIIGGQYRSAGVGLTLTRATTMLCLELPPTPGDLNQAEDRIHRMGQSSSVLIYHAILKGSLDARNIKSLIKKQEVISAAIDGKGRVDGSEPIVGGGGVP